MAREKLVVFGVSNFVSDIFDAALARDLLPSRVVVHLPEDTRGGNVPLAARVDALARLGHVVTVEPLAQFLPGANEVYILGPTNPARDALVQILVDRFQVSFCTLVHPAAHVSALAVVGQGSFVGAGAVVGPGAVIGEHVVINRGATVGHDCVIENYSRVQPGATVCGLSRIGAKVTIGAGATVIERLRIGDGASVGAGAVVATDVPAGAQVVGQVGKPSTRRK